MKIDLSSSRSECRSDPNPLQEWVDVFEFQITWLAKSRRPILKTFFGFLCSSIFPNSKDTRGPQMMDSFRSDLEICATHPQGGAQKKRLFFFYHTLLGSSIHVQNLLTRLIQIFEKSLKIKVFPYHFIKWVTQLQGVVILNVIKLENLLKIKNRRH